jgi:hypothetical protein
LVRTWLPAARRQRLSWQWPSPGTGDPHFRWPGHSSAARSRATTMPCCQMIGYPGLSPTCRRTRATGQSTPSSARSTQIRSFSSVWRNATPVTPAICAWEYFSAPAGGALGLPAVRRQELVAQEVPALAERRRDRVDDVLVGRAAGINGRPTVRRPQARSAARSVRAQRGLPGSSWAAHGGRGAPHQQDRRRRRRAHLRRPRTAALCPARQCAFEHVVGAGLSRADRAPIPDTAR